MSIFCSGAGARRRVRLPENRHNPSRFRGRHPLRLAVLVRVFHHDAEAGVAHHVVGRAQNPIAGLLHFHDGVDALAGAERDRLGHLRRGHRIAVEREYLETVPRQCDALVLDGARIQQVHQHAVALLHADRLARPEHFIVDRIHRRR